MATESMAYEGRCHCGAIGYTFRSAKPPSAWVVRACQCSFCHGHGARTAADPGATVEFRVADASKLNRYRFASRSVEFLICTECGGYIAALHTSSQGQFATLNVNAMQPPPQVPDAQPFFPDATPLREKQAGREQRWTPVLSPI